MLQQGTNEAENTNAHYLLQEEKSTARGGGGYGQHNSRTLLYTNNTLLLLSGANPITSTATIFMFLLELEAFATL